MNATWKRVLVGTMALGLWGCSESAQDEDGAQPARTDAAAPIERFPWLWRT